MHEIAERRMTKDNVKDNGYAYTTLKRAATDRKGWIYSGVMSLQQKTTCKEKESVSSAEPVVICQMS